MAIISLMFQNSFSYKDFLFIPATKEEEVGLVIFNGKIFYEFASSTMKLMGNNFTKINVLIKEN